MVFFFVGSEICKWFSDELFASIFRLVVSRPCFVVVLAFFVSFLGRRAVFHFTRDEIHSVVNGIRLFLFTSPLLCSARRRMLSLCGGRAHAHRDNGRALGRPIAESSLLHAYSGRSEKRRYSTWSERKQKHTTTTKIKAIFFSSSSARIKRPTRKLFAYSTKLHLLQSRLPVYLAQCAHRFALKSNQYQVQRKHCFRAVCTYIHKR